MADLLKEAQDILNDKKPDKQISCIVRLYKYVLEWSRKAFFEFVIETIPEIEPDITDAAKKTHNTSMLFAAMDTKQKSKIIQRLMKIEKKKKGKE